MAAPKKRRFAVLAAILAVVGALFFSSACSQPQPAPAPEPEPAPAETVTVPDVIWLDEADAQKHLAILGLTVGEIKHDYNDRIPAGLVAKQSPDPLTQAEPGTEISLVISRGPQAPKMVTMPNLVGMGQYEAERELIRLHIIAVRENPVIDTSVDPGKICKQSVPAGTQIPEGSTISFTTAIAEQPVTVPDVTGKTIDEAKAELEKAALGVDVSTAYDDKIEKDKIISQSVAAGTKVAKGTVVTLQASLGPKPAEKVKVPDIYTYTLDDAVAALKSAGLTYRYSGDDNGTVIAVDPEVGTEVEVGSTVTFVLKHAATMVTIPDVSGMSGGAAESVLNSVNLYLEYNKRDPDAVIDHTDPVAGTLVEEWTVVTGVYPDVPPEPTPVPGGWQTNTDFTPSLTPDEQAVADAALSQYSSTYTAVACLGTQVVNGTNYAFLCADSSGSGAYWNVVTVAQDADGNASVISDHGIDYEAVKTTDANSPMMGGWSVNTGAASNIPGDAGAALDSALGGMVGVSVRPVALLATQVTNGTNYLIIGVGGAVTPTAPGTVYVANVNAAASGDVSMVSLDALNLAAYTE